MKTADFDYQLPPHLIAQHPAPQRDSSRLLVLNRSGHCISHRRFTDLLDFLHPDDLLVLNNSRVLKARLRAINQKSSGAFEVLLLTQNAVNDWWVMLRPGKRACVGTQITIKNLHGGSTDITARVIDINNEGHRRLQFAGTRDISGDLDSLGEIPLPPYIQRSSSQETSEDLLRYQTVYAQTCGSVAAPTAGLHFTENLLQQIRSKQIHVHYVTLHVGLGTFAPVKADHLEAHKMHSEKFLIPRETAEAIKTARKENRRIIAVGTTTVRVLETIAPSLITQSLATDPLLLSGETNIFIHPPFQFRLVDALLTNFHLPRSTLLMLVSAFAAPGQTTGRDFILRAYREAIAQKYRFYSYGDAMLIL